MTDSRLIVLTGASGNVGGPALEYLVEHTELDVRAATRSGTELTDVDEVAFDFANPETHDKTFEGSDGLFLMRPNAISDVEDVIFPAVDAAFETGVEHIVTLSVQGADKNKWLPHRRLEKYVESCDVAWTHIRPGFFMQNLITVHLAGIREEGEIIVPSGNGKANFVDTRDVGAMAAKVFEEGETHFGKAYEPTGPALHDYHEVAEILSEVLGRSIDYNKPGYLRYIRYMLGHDYEIAFILFSCLPHTMVRLGFSEKLTDDVEAVLGRKPRSLPEFVRDHRNIF